MDRMITIQVAGVGTREMRCKRVIVSNDAPLYKLKQRALKAYYKQQLQEWIDTPFKSKQARTAQMRAHYDKLKAASKRGYRLRLKSNKELAVLLGLHPKSANRTINNMVRAGVIQTRGFRNRFYGGFYIKL